MSDSVTFPKNFLWGAATSAYQIEGAWNKGGRGESIWDRFCHTRGKIVNGDTGDIACDHYNRFGEDIELMKKLGLNAYRFSIAWPRVMPRGRGMVNSEGLDFYDRLVDGLLEAGIEPWATLFHWDLPLALQDLGGWANRDIAGYFADYSAVMVRRLGDRVKHWATINEPWVVAALGYGVGEHAPGKRGERLAIQVGHNLMVGHGLATRAIRECHAGPEAPKVGIVLNVWPTEPETDCERDKVIAELEWHKHGAWFLDVMFRGAYPPDAYKSFGNKVPHAHPGDFALASQKLDFLGVNYYSRSLKGQRGYIKKVTGSEYTEMDWEVHAPSLRRMLARISQDYKLPPIYITENGAAYNDTVLGDGSIDDKKRLSYIKDHLTQMNLAIQDGADVRGYFVWSLMDNFEWQKGFSKRFGIVHVDYKTQKRTIKSSGNWYANVIKNNSISD